jgi:PKD repeat protein
MKKIFTIVAIFAVSCASIAQQAKMSINQSTPNLIEVNGANKVSKAKTPQLMQTRSTECAVDNVYYPYSRMSEYGGLAFATDEMVFQGFPFNGEGNLVGADAEVTSMSVYNDGTFDGPTIIMEFTAIVYDADFQIIHTQNFAHNEANGDYATVVFDAPVFVDGDYWLSFINNTASDLIFWTNSATNGDGAGEGLAFVGVFNGEPEIGFYGIGDRDILLSTFIENTLTAEFTYPASPVPNQAITFENNSIIDDLGYHNLAVSNPSTDLYAWNFGDGNTSTEENPTHTYTTCGEYEVTLIISYVNIQGVVCSDTYTSTIIVTSDNTIVSLLTDASSCGASDGEIALNLGTASEEFSFTIGGTDYNSTSSAITVNTLAAGNYNFIVTTDDTNCEFNVSGTINETGAATITVSATEPSCFGGNDAVLTVASADDISGYTFTWSTNDVGTSIEGGAGAYTVSGTDGACNVNGSVTVTQPAEVVLNLSATAISCNGEEDAVITITSSEDISGYTFTWSTNEVANTITAGAGAYTVTGTDGTCESNGSITVTGPTAITIVGGVLGTDIGASATGGTGTLSYAWSGPSSFTAIGQAISVTENGTYTLTVTDANNCTSSAEYVVNSVSLFTNEIESISAYPNPTNDKINFNLNGTNAAFVTIYDAAGKFIATLNVENSFTSMSVSTIAEGLYIYHIMSNEGDMLTSSKFMVVR